jgi:hypothetical protein
MGEDLRAQGTHRSAATPIDHDHVHVHGGDARHSGPIAGDQPASFNPGVNRTG